MYNIYMYSIHIYIYIDEHFSHIFMQFFFNNMNISGRQFVGSGRQLRCALRAHGACPGALQLRRWYGGHAAGGGAAATDGDSAIK